MKSFYAYTCNSGYGLVLVEHDIPDCNELQKTAEIVAKACHEGKYSDSLNETSNLCVLQSWSFLTDAGTFSFLVNITPDRKEARIKVEAGEQIIENESMTLRVKELTG